MAGKALDYETCVNIWELVSTGAKQNAVARALNLAPATVSRVNNIFRAIRDGKQDEMNAANKRCETMVAYANRYFHPPIKVSEEPAGEENWRAEICARLSAISYGLTQMNEKLDRLCDLWEGK